MKHNQKDEASKQQSDKSAMPKNQQGNNGKTSQHGSSDRNQENDHQMGKGPKKHAEEGKTK